MDTRYGFSAHLICSTAVAHIYTNTSDMKRAKFDFSVDVMDIVFFLFFVEARPVDFRR